MFVGALLAVFGIYQFLNAENGGYRIGSILLVIGSVLLALVGIVTMNVGDGTPHNIVAQSMTLFLLMSAIAFGFGNWKSDHKIITGVILVIACMVLAMVFNFTVAQLEAYGIMLIMTWIVLESIRTLGYWKIDDSKVEKTTDATPRDMQIGSALGALGGMICIILFALSIGPNKDVIFVVAAYLLLAVLFFALAGALTNNGQWSWNSTFIMTFFTIGMVASMVVFDIVDVCLGIPLISIAALMVICLSDSSIKEWMARLEG